MHSRTVRRRPFAPLTALPPGRKVEVSPPRAGRAMLSKRIIPCLDVDRGRVVKGVNFLTLRDAGDPVAAPRRYEEQGADELVFLDISASHEGRAILEDMV